LGVFKSVVFDVNYLKYNTLYPILPPSDEFFGLTNNLKKNAKKLQLFRYYDCWL